jgi:hypothetical protein
MADRDDGAPGVITSRGHQTDHVTAAAKRQAEPVDMLAHCRDTPADLDAKAALLELSDERDRWLRRLLDVERAAYDRGFNDGRATACVALAEMQQRYDSVAWWREWAAKLARIIQNNDDPSVRMRQVMAEIHADQQFMREALRKRATKPGELSPLEACALRRIRLADPGDAVWR